MEGANKMPSIHPLKPQVPKDTIDIEEEVLRDSTVTSVNNSNGFSVIANETQIY